MNEQAGDPFEKTADPDSNEGRAEAIEALQNSHQEPTDETNAALKTLNDIEVEQIAAEVAEAEEEEHETAKLTLKDVRKIVQETSKAVRVATGNLEKARKAYALAASLESGFSVKLTLPELNAIQRRVTTTEDRRKARAMKALGELGFGNPKRKPHPQLF